MNEVKNISNQARQAYEPVQVKVTKVTPQGILCQSGGGDSFTGGISEMSRTPGSWTTE